MRWTPRERWLVVSLAILIGAWMLFTLGMRPAVERIETLNRVIPEKQRTLQQLRTKSTQYLALQTALQNLKSRANAEEKEFELLTFLESTTTDLRLAKKVTTMKQEVPQLDSNYTETVVEVKLENIILKQLVEFLLNIKSSNHLLRIKSLYIRKSGTNPNFLDSVIQVSTLKSNKAT